jgi:hypothetical protein
LYRYTAAARKEAEANKKQLEEERDKNLSEAEKRKKLEEKNKALEERAKLDMMSLEGSMQDRLNQMNEVGLYKFNAVQDPELETVWFQPLKPKCDILVSKFAFSNSPCTATRRT